MKTAPQEGVETFFGADAPQAILSAAFEHGAVCTCCICAITYSSYDQLDPRILTVPLWVCQNCAGGFAVPRYNVQSMGSDIEGIIRYYAVPRHQV